MSRRTKVLRIITRLNIGGPAIHTILLTEQLDPARFESLLVAGSTTPTEGDMLHLARRKHVAPHAVAELGRELNARDDLVALQKLYQLMRRERPQIVHTHMAKAGTLGRLAARLARVPVVVHTYHGHVFHSYFSRPKTALFLAIERVLARATDRLVVVGEQQRREIAAYRIAPLHKLVAIPLGLELEPFLAVQGPSGHLRAELGLGAATPLVGIVARLVPIKAHEDFLAAAARVRAALPEARFVVLGDGERRQELEALAKQLGLGAAVRFLGWRQDLPDLYADLDVVALSSLNEGSPVALIEAMAAGRAVAATNVGGVGEVVKDEVTGLTVPPRSPERLAEAMVRLLRDPALRARLGTAARIEVYPRHSVRRLCADVANLYVETLAARGILC
ncbi:MAG: glycosyltransferase [Chloroflexi bacterium]|nr:glycosyltransferase [Chloroflexota bacterium]